jgi:hypothetical protein
VGDFTVGGGGGANSFFSTTINTPDSRVTPSGVGSLGGMAGGYPSGFHNNYSQINIQPQFSDWPNGYKAFYCMKYEASQQQIVDFYNTLTSLQVYNLIYLATGSYRNMITWDYSSSGNLSTSLPNIACNYLAPTSAFAYADWSCLRPMTELEFEKACRGPLPSLGYYEFAWGNVVLATARYSLSYVGTESEGIASNYTDFGNANNYYSGGYDLGPLRVGIFAANGANTGRSTAGASYWGIMELSGNLSEPCISLFHTSGKKYRGSNGDGILALNGYQNVSNWPLDEWLLKGGDFTSYNYEDLAVPNRFGNGNLQSTGFRGVRSPAQ